MLKKQTLRNFSNELMKLELQEIIKSGINPVTNKKLSSDSKKEIKKLISSLEG